MGISMSTLGGYAVLVAVLGFYALRHSQERWARDAQRAAALRQRQEERQNLQSRKDAKEKAKRQRGEAYSKDVDESVKTTQTKPRAAPKAALAASYTPDFSSDDGVDNREFARQLASVKQGTNLSTAKKTDEKRQKSVKQSRARSIDDELVSDNKASAPSSTAGADADDDESPIASPEVTAVDAGDVTDMLEPKSAGPAVLRLTDTDKVKQPKEKNAKAPEKVETKKQRQNRQKTEAAKVAREETEKQRQVALEAQRRLARISEGRAAKDGSAFMAAQAPKSVWTGNGAKASSTNSSVTNGDYVAVQPLDTFDTSSHTDVSTTKTAPVTSNNNDSWMSSLPSEEEQMEILRGQEEWSTVTTKKAGKGKKKEPVAGSISESEPSAPAAAQPKQVAFAPVVSQPAAKAPKATTNGKSAKPFSQQSSFAALSTNDEPDVENEWDV